MGVETGKCSTGQCFDKIEEAFQKTSQILLGRRLMNLPDYRSWLLQNVNGPVRIKSEVSNRMVFVPNLIFYTSIGRNMVKLDEAPTLGQKAISLEEIKALRISNAPQVLSKIRYVTSEVIEGENTDIRESAAYMNAHYCLEGVFYIYSKYDAYCFWPRETQYSFGCQYLFASEFCIQCHNSVALSRCFEVSDSNRCSDCYFCHNCEGCNDCMFCFNVKSKRYAIGNVEIGRERYVEIKKRLLEDISGKLKTEKKLDVNIYNIGCR